MTRSTLTDTIPLPDSMRVCPKCQAVYQGDERACPVDGTPLEETSSDSRPFATTALGPGDVRDTPILPPLQMSQLDPGETDPLLGTTLRGRYRIEKRLGEGGMGMVYIAEHVNLKKRVALKVLLKHVATQRSAVERLKQEAIAASAIEHDNIVSVFDCEETEDGNVFIAMELLKGEDLASTIGRGPLLLERALHVAYQICRALGAAHAEGIVHRDLKPENVFLTRKGDSDFVKVLDFGISKIKATDAEQTRMTKTGQIVGTPLYMSPEQAKGETDLDYRTDIYALGVILYEMLTGSTPFRGENYFQVIWQHTNEPPPPMRKRNPNVPIPEALEAVVQKALAKTREARFQSMAELEAALVKAVPAVAPPPAYMSRPSGATPVSMEVAPVEHGRRHPGLLFAVGAALLIGSAGAVWLATRPPAAVVETVPTHTTVTPPNDPGPGITVVTGPEPPPINPAPPGPDPVGATPTVERFEIAFESTPPGAEVRILDRAVGRTPCTIELAASEAPLEARFVLRGYVEDVERFTPAHGATVAGRLRPVRRAGGGADPGSKVIKGWN